MAARYQLSEQARGEFALAGTRLVELILDSAFEPGEESQLLLTCQLAEGGLELVVRDQGLPMDEQRWCGEQAGDSLRTIRANVDELRHTNLGVEGQETRLVKYLYWSPSPGGSARGVCPPPPYLLRPPLEHESEEQPQPAAEGPLTYRTLRPGEGVGVSRCVYRCYGYSYAAVEAVYYPERLEAMVAAGKILSMVAATACEQVVGHVALERVGPGARVATAGVAAVLPEFRSRGVAGQLSQLLLQEGIRQGVREIQAYGVTSHTYSQRLFAEHGFKIQSLWLGTAYFHFKGIRERPAQRESLVGAILLVGKPSEPEVLYPPIRHRAMIETICAHIGLPVELRETDEESQGHGELAVHTSPIRNLAKMSVERYGRDLLDQVRVAAQQLKLQGYRQLSLTMPLAHPGAASLSARCERLGFFFAGLLRRETGTCLVLQHLHGVAIDYDQILVLDPMARELKAYVRCQDPLAL